jgi:hypothetical protein
MDKKEFNILINEISEKLNPLNQLLYQCLILIVFYYFFSTVKKLELHRCFILLFAIICTILDLCIWNNINQTLLFICILGIYITYNIKKDKVMDNFINIMNTINNNKNDSIKDLWLKEEIEKKNNEEIDKITFVPKNIYEKRNKNKNNSNSDILHPEPYDKSQSEINEVKLAYKPNTTEIYSIDTKYSNTMLNNLYNTPQYKNIKKQSIDKLLDNDIHFSSTNNNSNSIINKDNNIELFRKPKVQFLDDKWLSNKDNSYNDNCKTNKCVSTHNTNNTKNTNTRKNTNTKNTTNTSDNKNAICSLYEFGTTLSECTNQSNTITDNQLDKISNNSIDNSIDDSTDYNTYNSVDDTVNDTVNDTVDYTTYLV